MLLSNVRTGDSYGPGASIEGVQVVYVMLQVHHAAVYVQRQPDRLTPRGRGLHPDSRRSMTSGMWDQEMLLPPGIYQWRRRLRGIRVRSAIAGQPALIVLEALTHGE